MKIDNLSTTDRQLLHIACDVTVQILRKYPRKTDDIAANWAISAYDLLRERLS